MSENVHEPDRFPATAEEKLSAYLLDELSVEQRAEVEAALAADPALRARREQLAAVLGTLRQAPSTARALATGRRAELRRAAASASAPGRRGGVLRWSHAVRWAAVLAAFAGAAWWWRDGRSTAPAIETAAAIPAPAAEPAKLPEAALVELEGLGYVADGQPHRVAGEAPKASQEDVSNLAAYGYLGGGSGGGGGKREKALPELDAGVALGQAPAMPAPAELRLRFAEDTAAGAAGRGQEQRADDDAEAPHSGRFAAPAGPGDVFVRVAATPPAAPGRVVVIDGYGRSYHDHRVVEDYLCRRPHESPRDMFFRYYGDHAQVRTAEDPLSTFAADVDTASYPLARNYLVHGDLPPRAAIRTEEFVNYFRYELPPPVEQDFAVSLRFAPTPFGGLGSGILMVGIKARELDRATRKPLNLVFVIDRSGSMASGQRIELVKRSLELLVDQLRDDDTVGIVSFESQSRLELEPTPGYERWKIREAVRGLATGGSTNAEAGLVLGYELAERAFREQASNRIVLCSDGVANTGETDQERILERVRRSAERSIDLTTVGVGMGNHNDVFLERLANAGDGSCHYVDDFEEAKRVFVERFTGTMQTVARDVKIQVEFEPGKVVAWRQLGYENRAIADADFRNDAVDAGEVGAGHEVIGLYELQLGPDPAAADWLAKVRLRWFPDGANAAVETETTLPRAAAAGRFELADPRFRLAVVAAQYAEVLRRSYWARYDSYPALVEAADRLAGELAGDPQVRELRDMIVRTRQLADRLLPPSDELALLLDESRRLRLLAAEAEGAREPSVELAARLDELRQRNDELERRIRELLED